ncbi:teichuronic acid biosynthesis protein TuaC [Peribacillus sp. SCS-37]|uniref:teichuronic acid biosynthesis protein TuaC n=1 Tax=Paraperibacillus esterisolvens TaxID=3115296 RepID=UPI00390656ED
MKALWITSAYPSEIQPGSGVFHETQAKALTKLGVEVSVVCPVPKRISSLLPLKERYRELGEIPKEYIRNGIRVLRPEYTALPGQLRWAQPGKRIAEAVYRTGIIEELEPDLIHAHFAMPSGGAARLLSKRTGLPWLLTLHGSDVNVYPHYSRSARAAFIHSMRDAHSVLSVGGRLREKALSISGRDSSILPLGVDLARFQTTSEPKAVTKKRLRLPADKKIVLFAGRLTREKGVFELADSLKRLRADTAVVFAGAGPAAARLREYPEFGDRLFLTGEVENREIRDYMNASDVFALPSYTEGMPTVVIEALALKLPVAATLVGSLPELFGKYSRLLFEPRQEDQLAERITEYLKGGMDLEAMKKELFEKIHEHYHAGRNALLLKEEYSRVIQGAGISI